MNNYTGDIHGIAFHREKFLRVLGWAFLGLAISAGPFPVYAQSADCAALASAKAAAYGFHPTDLNHAQQIAKSDEMDRFWAAAKSEGPKGIKCLRDMILAEKSDTFFLYDASSLLYSLDQSPESLHAIAQALAGADLKDIAILDYIRFVLHLNRNGVDVGPLAVKYLYYPKVDAYVPQHSMTLDRTLGGIILFGSLAPNKVDTYLIPALSADQDYVRSTAALILALNMTPDDFRALRTLHLSEFPEGIRQQIEATIKPGSVKAITNPKLNREQVLKRLHQTPDYDASFAGVAGNQEFISSALSTLTADDIEALCKARRLSITGVSDEGIDEYVALSQILLGVIVRLNIYAEARGTTGTN